LTFVYGETAERERKLAARKKKKREYHTDDEQHQKFSLNKNKEP